MKRLISAFILLCFIVTGIMGPCPTYASEGFALPVPGQMVALSPAFSPVVLRGIKLDPKNPFRFHFYVDTGDSLPKHNNKDIDNGLYLAIEAWNKRAEKDDKNTFIYGGENTIHRTKLLNIEIDRWTGKVVSVWFRCLHLPFDVTSVDKNRSKEMKRVYEENEPVKINAIEVEK